MRLFAIRSLTFMAVCALLAGCASDPFSAPKPVPRITLDHLDPLPISVQDVQVATAYRASPATQEALRDFPNALDEILLAYGHKRLAPSSGFARLTYSVERADLTKQRLTPGTSVEQWARVNFSDQYDADIVLRLATHDSNGQELRTSNLTFRRSLILPDTLTLAEKERRRQTFVEQIIRDVDQGVIKALVSSLGVLPSAPSSSTAPTITGVGMQPVIEAASITDSGAAGTASSGTLKTPPRANTKPIQPPY